MLCCVYTRRVGHSSARRHAIQLLPTCAAAFLLTSYSLARLCVYENQFHLNYFGSAAIACSINFCVCFPICDEESADQRMSLVTASTKHNILYTNLISELNEQRRTQGSTQGCNECTELKDYFNYKLYACL